MRRIILARRTDIMKEASNIGKSEILKSESSAPTSGAKVVDSNPRPDKFKTVTGKKDYFKGYEIDNKHTSKSGQYNQRGPRQYNQERDRRGKNLASNFLIDNTHTQNKNFQGTVNEESFWNRKPVINEDNYWGGASSANQKSMNQIGGGGGGSSRMFDNAGREQRGGGGYRPQHRNMHISASSGESSTGSFAAGFNKRKLMGSSKFGLSDPINQEKWFNVIPRSLEYERQMFKQDTMATGINFDKYDDIPVNVEGKEINITPQLEIKDCNLNNVFMDNLEIAGYTKLTPIQKYSFPCLLQKHDLLACAQTGSGKTVAFVLPLLNHIYNEGFYSPRTKRSHVAVCMPKALIMAPTRELAHQIHDVAVKFSYRTELKPAIVYGGVSIKDQYISLYHRGHVLVGTPGRLIDMYRRGYISFANCRYVVLDEADRMLDMGFEPQINDVLSTTNMPPKEERLNCMFSATFQDDVKRLVTNYMKDPYVMITVGKVGGTTDNITQTVLNIQPHEKFGKLLDCLVPNEKVLIFTETKSNADWVEMNLYENEYKVVCIHGDRDQRERDIAIHLFKTGKAKIMVATGVASRGLDIPDVKKVILYDAPRNIDDYIHRIGRTGRAGNVGEAITFYYSGETNIARDLVNVLNEAKQEIPSFLKADVRGGFYSNNSGNYFKGYGGPKRGGFRTGGGNKYGIFNSRFDNDSRRGGDQRNSRFSNYPGGDDGGRRGEW